MFKKWFGSKEAEAPLINKAPEILDLHLGGTFELDALKIRLIESKIIPSGISTTQIIEAVGEVKLDNNSRLLRFYTDDDGYLQVLLSGGNAENNIADVKLWYYYDTQTVGNNSDWQTLLNQKISQEVISLEGHTYTRVWGSAGASNPPVAMTEITHSQEGKDTTDQFVMLYQREIEADLFEYVMYSGEEKIVDNNYERCFVISTGIDLNRPDFSALT